MLCRAVDDHRAAGANGPAIAPLDVGVGLSGRSARWRRRAARRAVDVARRPRRRGHPDREGAGWLSYSGESWGGQV